MKPVLQALLLADHVYQDRGTGKYVVAGIFHDLVFVKPEQMQQELERRSPNAKLTAGGMSAGSPYAYISMTAVRGEQRFSLRYVELDENKPLFGTEFSVKSSDPLATVEVVVALPPLPTGKAGVFALELLWENELLGLFRIRANEAQLREQGNGTNGND